jgi:flagellar hook-basal body complex protein FliE
MEINRIGMQPLIGESKLNAVAEAQNTGPSFSEVLNQQLHNVNKTLIDSQQMSVKLATGDVKNIHDVTIAAQKATIALQMTVQVRDKVVEAYQEVMRMQI